MTVSIAQRIAQIRQQLPPHVRLIAVSKGVTTDAMKQAYIAGIRDFGESRLQEALPKQEQLKNLSDICWHFIGHLQTNKAKKVVEHFHWIHAVDSLKLAQRLNQVAADAVEPPFVCLQVKVLSDPDKYGWHVPELLADFPQLEQCDRLNIRGLMTILPLELSEAQILAAFEATRDLAKTLTQKSAGASAGSVPAQAQRGGTIQLKELSMGMSSDYWLAVKAGATMIRLGRSVFGERN